MAIPGQIKGPKYLAPTKMQQILAAAQEQLSKEDFSEMLKLVEDFYRHGISNWINCRLGELISTVDWELDISDSPEWHEALSTCDGMFLLTELKALCDDLGLGTGGHKKILCRKLYMAGYEPVVAIMQPIIDRGEVEEVEQLPQTIMKTTTEEDTGIDFWLQLERIRRTDPDMFHRRQRELMNFINQLQR